VEIFEQCTLKTTVRGADHYGMVVWFTTTCAIMAYHR